MANKGVYAADGSLRVTIAGGSAGGDVTIGTTTITGGTDTRVLFNDGGVIGEDAGFTYNKTTDIITGPLGIKFGGTTSSFPYLKRSSATLQVRLADDSAYARIDASASIFSDGTNFSLTNPTLVSLPASGAVAFTSTVDGTSGQDLYLYRDAANTLAQRNGTNANSFLVYNTYTDASNYERLELRWVANIANLYLVTAGTGTATRALGIGTQGGGNLNLFVADTNRWQVAGSSGHFLAAVDNTYDIGASGATRPRTGYFAANVLAEGVASVISSGLSMYVGRTTAATAVLGHWTRGYITFNADGVWQMTDNAATGFGSLLFGPSGTTYNRLKHGGTGLLQVRLADDSAFAAIQGKLRTQANAVAETPTATHTMIITDAGGTAYRVLCVV